MLRILENCDITCVITALLELIKEFQEKEDKNLVNLAIKCLLKTTHNLSENIDKVDISKILLQIHLLLLSLQKNNKDLNKKTQTNVLIINTVKSIVGDFVKLKKFFIYYILFILRKIRNLLILLFFIFICSFI